jgi:hypothetical protein
MCRAHIKKRLVIHLEMICHPERSEGSASCFPGVLSERSESKACVSAMPGKEINPRMAS